MEETKPPKWEPRFDLQAGPTKAKKHAYRQQYSIYRKALSSYSISSTVYRTSALLATDNGTSETVFGTKSNPPQDEIPQASKQCGSCHQLAAQHLVFFSYKKTTKMRKNNQDNNNYYYNNNNKKAKKSEKKKRSPEVWEHARGENYEDDDIPGDARQHH